MRYMSVCRFQLILCLATLSTALGLRGQTPSTTHIQQIYVEPFATQAGSEKFREDVIAALHKQGSVSLAADESGAEAILGGGGAVWIQGYRSHNPQLGNVPANGTPIYTGFLSIELRDKNGETLWSYLATPPTASADVTKDLSTEIAAKLVEFLHTGELPSPTTTHPQPTTILRGAGATFPYPVYEKWIANYRREVPAVEITYDPVGSEAGVRRLLEKAVDFGASDSPEAIHDLAPGDEQQYLFFPSVVGAVVPVVNLPGVSGDVAFTPEALAGIYLGKIKKWNDPILLKSNRGLPLPALDIEVVHRADGSGSTYAWTDYLSRTSAEWKAEVGTSLNPKWPVGHKAIGNDGVSRLVKEQTGSIGYVEFIYALQNHLSYGKVLNRDRKFVAASLESMAATASHLKSGEGISISIVDAPGKGSYPICSFTWIVVPAQAPPDDVKRKALLSFLEWMLGPGQRQAAALGYLPLPKEILSKERVAIARLR
jgi:phosphate ABC transporter phosphate-binding protein